MSSIWVLVNCNSENEAVKIGKAVLEKRLVSCFDIFERKLTRYFWPPKRGEIESAKGALLVIETLKFHYRKLYSLIKEIHSDQLPFIGFIGIEGTDQKI